MFEFDPKSKYHYIKHLIYLRNWCYLFELSAAQKKDDYIYHTGPIRKIISRAIVWSCPNCFQTKQKEHYINLPIHTAYYEGKQKNILYPLLMSYHNYMLSPRHLETPHGFKEPIKLCDFHLGQKFERDIKRRQMHTIEIATGLFPQAFNLIGDLYSFTELKLFLLEAHKKGYHYFSLNPQAVPDDYQY